MRICPINQSPVMFRGYKVNNQNAQNHQNRQNHVMRRYCEPGSGAYFYETPQNQNGLSFESVCKNFAKKFSNLSKDFKDTFTLNNITNSESDDTLWL